MINSETPLELKIIQDFVSYSTDFAAAYSELFTNRGEGLFCTLLNFQNNTMAKSPHRSVMVERKRKPSATIYNSGSYSHL